MQIGRWIAGLAISLGLSVLAGHAGAEPRIALVVGNAHYAEDAQAIPNAVNDAKLIAATLKSVGFQVTMVTDVDRAQMDRAIGAFVKRLGTSGADTTGLLYYAGKGMQSGDQTYMLPSDVAINDHFVLADRGIALDAVVSAMVRAGAKIKIIVFDASRTLPPNSSDITKRFSPASETLGTIMAFSSAPGSDAFDGVGADSPYAEALAGAIPKPGLTSDEVFRNVRIDVLKATDERQVPWDSSSLAEPFYFVPN